MLLIRTPIYPLSSAVPQLTPTSASRPSALSWPRAAPPFLLGQRRVFQVEIAERLIGDGRDDQAHEPLVVGGHNVPRAPPLPCAWTPPRTRACSLPVTRARGHRPPRTSSSSRVVEALEEAPLLLLPRDVQEELAGPRCRCRARYRSKARCPRSVVSRCRLLTSSGGSCCPPESRGARGRPALPRSRTG